MNAKLFLTDAQREQIEEAVRKAEAQTSAELMCAVATESGRYDRAEALWGFIFALFGLAFAHVATNGFWAGEGSWTGSDGAALAWQAIAATIGFFAGNIAAAYLHPMRKLLVSSREMEDEVARAAVNVFSQQQLFSSKCGAGVLLYVSLFERRVVILAAPKVMDAIGQEKLDLLRDAAVRRLKSGPCVNVFIETLTEAASALETTLPAAPDDEDFLPNHLAIIHPRP